jgi:DNA-binding winged helix-turn-helix (wHTH) protein/TolB-like protein
VPVLTSFTNSGFPLSGRRADQNQPRKKTISANPLRYSEVHRLARKLTQRFKFGEFEFDPETSILTHRGREVSLQAQPALLLGVLLAQRDQIVSRDDLTKAIWGNDTHVDFEKGLNFCIGQVRAALRDDASRPVYIRTTPKLGYQFIAPVTTVAAQGNPIEPGDVLPSSRRNLTRLTALAIPAIIIVALGTIAFLLRPAAPDVPNLAVVHFDAETSTPAAQALADELTDDVIVRLASQSGGHYRVIGNASILRTPREQRDLRAIASSLRCSYAVMGQIQTDGDRVLVLAHLIRLSVTHIWVVRFERKAGEPSTLESQGAAEIASQFAARMSNRPDSASSFGAGSR